MKRYLTIFCLVIFALAAFAPGTAQRAEASLRLEQLRPWPAIDFQEVIGGLDRPVYLTHAGDSSGRLFVVEQPGRIRIVQGGNQPVTFLDLRNRVRSPASGGGNEEGLLSVAFPPGFAQKQVFYVYYTGRDGNNHISRFRVSANPNQADPGSEEPILLLEHPTYGNHNGGGLVFGPDGYLYIGTGDGGGSGDPDENAQDPTSLLGKLLRIDVESGGSQPPTGAHRLFLPMIPNGEGDGLAQSRPYRIPAGNPYANGENAAPEVWALGLRNPWRFSFDRETGDLWIGDVGQGRFEEINHTPAPLPAGLNYGWDILEGDACFEPSSGCSEPANYNPPVLTYRHSDNNPGGCSSVTGGFVYRGEEFPTLNGFYFYADYCSGRVWAAQPQGTGWESTQLANTGYWISSFGEDQAGELYLVDLVGGRILKLVEVGR